MNKILVTVMDGGKMPTRNTEEDAGWDLYAKEDYVLKAHSGTVKLPIGIKVAIPFYYCGIIQPRSSVWMRSVYSHGVIDSGFRGEISVLINNLGNDDFIIHKGDRIAQMVIVNRNAAVVMEDAESLPESLRGESGWGSSGK